MPAKQRCLMLGSGHSAPGRRMRSEGECPDSELVWTTLDCNPDCHPDVVFDLDRIEKLDRLPFDDETFLEIHAYEVMEHYGHQGDFIGFFTGMRELWRILKPSGILFGTCPLPSSPWAWADPGHRRVIASGTIAFLGPAMYARLGNGPGSDYRWYVEPCWWAVDFDVTDNCTRFALRKMREVG